MADDVREHLEEWLSLNRDFLWKVMSQKEKVDAVFRDRSVSNAELARVCDEVEAYLDELKDMLKKLYLVLYESQDFLKKAQEKQEIGHKFEEDQKRKKEEAEKKGKEEAELRRKMERERIEAAARSVPSPAPPKAEPAPPPKEEPQSPAAKAGKSFATLEVAKEVSKVQEEKEEDEKESEVVEIPSFELKVPGQIGGLIAFLGLGEWFKGVDTEDQRKIVGIMISDGHMSQYDVLEREIETLRTQFAPYCWKTANKLMRSGYDELATGLLIKGLTVVTAKRDKEMLHIMYAKYFYRQRKVLKNAYDACINHCEKAIKSYMQDKENRPKPVAPFKLLTMIYEEQSQLKRIIDVCDRAIKLYQGGADESKVLGFLRIKDILSKKEGQVKEEEAKPQA
jgi:hypothetical protein